MIVRYGSVSSPSRECSIEDCTDLAERFGEHPDGRWELYCESHARELFAER